MRYMLHVQAILALQSKALAIAIRLFSDASPDRRTTRWVAFAVQETRPIAAGADIKGKSRLSGALEASSLCEHHTSSRGYVMMLL